MSKNRCRLTWSTFRRSIPASCGGLLSLLLLGCQLGSNLENLAKELASPDKETFDTPQLFLRGEYRALSVDGTSRTGPFITAVSKDDELAILPFDSVKECSVGPISAFRPAMLKDSDSSSEDARIPFIARKTEDAPDQLRFTNFHCEVSEVTLDTNMLPLNDKFAKAGGIVAQSADGNIWHLDPWTDDKEQVASNTAAISRSNHAMFANGLDGKSWMFTLENGEIVGRDNQFKEVFRSEPGFDVVLHHQSNDDSIVLVAQRWKSVAEDSEEMVPHWFLIPLADPDSEQLVAENACSMRVIDGTSGRELLYSDCATGDLVWYSFKTDETHILAENVKSYRLMGKAPDGPILLYLERDESDKKDVGPLYARWGLATPSFLGAQGHLSLSWISSSGSQRPVIDWSDGAGTLKYGAVGKELRTVAKDVVHVSSLGVISDYDGQNGVFSRLSGGNLTHIYDRIHANGILADSQAERVLLISDFEDGRGSLMLVNGEEHLVLVDGVQPGAYQYAAAFPMVSVLNDYQSDTGTATLRMVRTDRAKELEIATGVRESLEIGWPEQGLLFSAPQGDPPGVYFAKAL